MRSSKARPRGSRRLRRGTTALALAAAPLALWGCGGGSSGGGAPSSSAASTTAAPATTTIAGVAASDHGALDVRGMAAAQVELDDMYFKPTVLHGSPGQRIRLKLSNEGSLDHNFSLTAQRINTDVAAGAKATVTVTFPRTGTLLFYCEYHRDRGMAGALSVG
jgi:plastocyanin